MPGCAPDAPILFDGVKSIVKRIVESIGGQIWIEDAQGGGACFAIRLVKAGQRASAKASRDAAESSDTHNM